MVIARKIGVFAIVAVFLYNLLGYFVLFCYRKHEIHQMVTEKWSGHEIPRADLLLIKVPAALYTSVPEQDFQQIEGTFTYDGKVYDLVKYRLVKDTLYVYCAHNILTERLIANFSVSLQQGTGDIQGAGSDVHQLIKLLGQIYLAATCTLSNKKSFSSSLTYLFSPTENYLPTHYLFIESPPPEPNHFPPLS